PLQPLPDLLPPVAVPHRPGADHRRRRLPRAQRAADHPPRLHPVGDPLPARHVVRGPGHHHGHRHPRPVQDHPRDHRRGLMAVDAPTTRTRAVRPRTLRDARAAYGTNSELAWWVFMRISGFLLVFLVFAHVFTNNIVMNAGEIDFDYVAQRL